MTITLMELMNDASAVSCKLDEFETNSDELELTARPILCPCVKHEIEGVTFNNRD